MTVFLRFRRYRPQRSGLLLATLVAPSVVWMAVLASQAGTGIEVQHAVLPPQSSASSTSIDTNQNWKYVGISSCAAAACHGGTMHDPPPPDRTRENRSAYRVWVEQDKKHANAYSVLFRDDAKQMARRLGPPLDPNHMEHARLCLDCHSNNARNRAPSLAQEDGVSCESCHGPASAWKDQHWLGSWKTKTVAEKQALGMNNLRGDLVARARACVDCHVGSADREVNHDLIAAGHPRLNFEFAAFHETLPHHWSEAQDRALVSQQAGVPFDGALWVVGQVVSARAAAALLDRRAQRVSSPSNKQPWPELSEYDCYACHHPLVPNSWRQQVSSLPSDKRVRPGMPRPNSWYFSMLAPIHEELRWEVGGTDVGMFTRSATGRFDQETPDLAQIRLAKESLTALERRLSWSPTNRGLPFSREQLRLLLNRVTRLQSDDRITDWDRVAQAYLAAVPLQSAIRETTSGPGHAPATDPRARDLLKKIVHALEFPANSQSPSEMEWGDEGRDSRGRSAIDLLQRLPRLIEEQSNSRSSR
jgi:hypothetical protein